MAIVLGAPRTAKSKVSISIEARDAGRYLKTGTFWADYGDLDISGVDPALLILPALGTVLPVSYATGIAVIVDSVDRDYADAAAELAPMWSAMYPRFAAGNRFSLSGAHVTAEPGPTGGGSGLLYSGGVDSAASLLANRDAVRAIFSVWGADVPLENQELWRELSGLISTGPLTRGITQVAVSTNSRDFVKQFRVIHDFLGPDGDWWGWVQHGLALLSLTAPATAALGLDQVLIASSHTTAFSLPWGSSPQTDNLVRWTGTTVRHDLFELSRQQKISQYLAPYLKAGGHIDLAVCHQPARGAVGVNCGHCEKCLRTATGLLAAGATPAEVGLPIDIQDYASWRAQLISGGSTLDANALFHWRVIQQGIPADPDQDDPQIRDYLRWLRGLDLNSLPSPVVRTNHGTAELRFQLRRGADLLPESSQQVLRRLTARWSQLWHRTAVRAPELSPATSTFR